MKKDGQLMIEKSFKLKFFLKFTAIIIGSIALMAFILFVYLPKPDITRYTDVVASFVTADDMLMPAFVAAEVIEVIVIIVVIALISVFASHKIAGPIYRVEKTIECLLNADFAHTVQFRSYDQLQCVAEVLNNTCRKFGEKLNAVSSAYEAFEKERKEPEKTSGSLERLKEKIDILGREIKKFNF